VNWPKKAKGLLFLQRQHKTKKNPAEGLKKEIGCTQQVPRTAIAGEGQVNAGKGEGKNGDRPLWG